MTIHTSPVADIAKVRVQTSETGNVWMVIAEDQEGNPRVVESHAELSDALAAATSLGGPLTLCNQSVLGQLRRRGRL